MEKSTLPNLMSAEFAASGKKRIAEFGKAQTEFVDKLQELNRQWFERMRSEATLASEFAAQLTAARSIPEVATAYQEWANRHMEMAAEDPVFADSQKLVEAGAHFLSNGWLSNGKASGT